MTHVFVYGTLMRGGANHAVLLRLGARYLAAARTKTGRVLVDLGPYPALLPSDRLRDELAPNVHGELYVLDDASLPSLDAFEGCPSLYARERIDLVVDGGAIEAWVYVLARDVPKRARVVATGRYESGGVVLEDGAGESDLPGDS
jgi:gamma-glutamylcyclotransferase (GGCT)/AIG2-like uncharacterized protein YtfP